VTGLLRASDDTAKACPFSIMLIGFFMAAFTERKQALPDILASCLVGYRDPPSGLPAFQKDHNGQLEGRARPDRVGFFKAAKIERLAFDAQQAPLTSASTPLNSGSFQSYSYFRGWITLQRQTSSSSVVTRNHAILLNICPFGGIIE
jgi:hypothetical protein